MYSFKKGKTPTFEKDWGSANPECGDVTPADALNTVLDTFLSFGASLAAVFKPGLTLSDKSALRSIIIKGRKSLLRVFYFDFFERPNLHVGLHLDREADLHGTPTQTEVSIKEMVHKRPKATAVHGNHKQIARDMLLHENAEQALKFVLRGGVDGLTPGVSLTGLVVDPDLAPIFREWLKIPQDTDGGGHMESQQGTLSTFYQSDRFSSYFPG